MLTGPALGGENVLGKGAVTLEKKFQTYAQILKKSVGVLSIFTH